MIYTSTDKVKNTIQFYFDMNNTEKEYYDLYKNKSFDYDIFEADPLHPRRYLFSYKLGASIYNMRVRCYEPLTSGGDACARRGGRRKGYEFELGHFQKPPLLSANQKTITGISTKNHRTNIHHAPLKPRLSISSSNA